MRDDRPSAGAAVFGTFGVYRLALAAAVVFTHTTGWRWVYPGLYAVFAFYVLSGYVVAFILDRTYLRASRGLARFAANRALRVFPLYWLTLAASLILIARYPSVCRSVFPDMVVPEGLLQWASNLTTLGLSHPLRGSGGSAASVVPVGWTLGVELTYWALLPAAVVWPWFRRAFGVIAVGYTAVAVSLLLTAPELARLGWRIYNLGAAALPFWAGLWIFERKIRSSQPLTRSFGLGALAFCGFWAGAVAWLPDPLGWPLYVWVIGTMAAVTYLAQLHLRALPGWFRTLDKFSGDLSYPLYLLHMPVAVVVRVWVPLPPGSYRYFAAVLVLSLAASVVAHAAVEAPVNFLRSRVKRARATGQAVGAVPLMTVPDTVVEN
jgi:peptidoglycan/LPS O-acetylase OafA/YrhL